MGGNKKRKRPGTGPAESGGGSSSSSSSKQPKPKPMPATSTSTPTASGGQRQGKGNTPMRSPNTNGAAAAQQKRKKKNKKKKQRGPGSGSGEGGGSGGATTVSNAPPTNGRGPAAPAAPHHPGSPAASPGGKKKHKNKKRKRGSGGGVAGLDSPGAADKRPRPTPTPPAPKASGGLSSLQAKMKARLEGARFRDINELLYTTRGDHALAAFGKEPELFDAYHKGFREQVAKWPRNPLDDMIDWVKRQPREWVVADFGCGEARLAASVPHKVHSFDLVAPNARVTACDIAHVPLPAQSVHAVVFCLSLMGTNMMDFVKEACRVLKPKGVIKVAEVRSRFEGQDGGIEAFVAACKGLGLACRRVDKGNKMFFLADFVKEGGGTGGGGDKQQQKHREKPKQHGGKGKGGGKGGGGGGQGAEAPVVAFQAKPCIYKRR